MKRQQHRMSSSPEWVAYKGAKTRCNNPHCPKWKSYGGRGIKFLFTDFLQFYAELGPKPSPLHSIDRINNDGNYEPGNVRWATRLEQAKNVRPQPPHSLEHNRKIALAQIGKKITEEHMRKWQLAGRTPEALRKRSESLKAWWANKKANAIQQDRNPRPHC